ncbi:hypothetical protein [Citrobacter freundii]|uniref:Uncharacterized protein n=1 Tax=Citrobacter freundii TaxID=546 RepID=A0A7G2ILA0_CITFR|nr:hypothetical protein [Citrobacter freundii]
MSSLQRSDFQLNLFCCLNKNTVGQVWAGPAENCRRVSARPGEPAWMLAQGALYRDVSSRPAR